MDKNNEGAWYFTQNIISSAKGADAVVILTEWDEYSYLDWEKISSVLRKPSWLFDARSVIPPEIIKNLKLNLWRIGDGMT